MFYAHIIAALVYNQNSLVYKSLLENYEQNSDKQNCWVKYVNEVLNVFDMKLIFLPSVTRTGLFFW